MAIKITDECINCGACEPECPNTAIYESGVGWKFSEGTALTSVEERNGIKIDPNKENNPKEEEFFYIVTDKCTECNGFHDEPQCAAVCPVDLGHSSRAGTFELAKPVLSRSATDVLSPGCSSYKQISI